MLWFLYTLGQFIYSVATWDSKDEISDEEKRISNYAQYGYQGLFFFGALLFYFYYRYKHPRQKLKDLEMNVMQQSTVMPTNVQPTQSTDTYQQQIIQIPEQSHN